MNILSRALNRFLSVVFYKLWSKHPRSKEDRAFFDAASNLKSLRVTRDSISIDISEVEEASRVARKELKKLVKR